MLSLQTVNKNLVPSNATSDITMIQNYALQDKEGNDIYTKYDKNNNPKLYINKNNKEYEVQKEDETDNYYIIGSNNSKEYLELNSVPLIAKVTMKKNTLLTTELLSKGDNQVQDDVRKQEYNMIVLPIDLVTGVARTCREPLLTARAVSFSVTVRPAVPTVPILISIGIPPLLMDLL